MNHIVQEFTNPQLKAKYQKAIESFRLPYWDYYKPRYSKETTFNGVAGVDRRTTSFPYDFGLPRILIESDVMVVRPTSNEPKPMRNPLNYFNFPTLKPTIKPEDWKATTSKDGKRKFDTRRTQRFPDEILKLGMNEREEKTNAILNNQRESNVTLILDMIAGDPRNDPYDSFTSFATNAASDGASGNLESLHGSYHVMVGGFGGHMSFVPLAAFDPVFWMHHWYVIVFLRTKTNTGIVKSTGTLRSGKPFTRTAGSMVGTIWILNTSEVSGMLFLWQKKRPFPFGTQAILQVFGRETCLRRLKPSAMCIKMP